MNKPEVYTVKRLDLFECLNYLECIGHTGIKKRILDEIEIRGNDSILEFLLPPEIDEEYYSKQFYEDTLLIKKTWDIKDDSIEMYVTW